MISNRSHLIKAHEAEVDRQLHRHMSDPFVCVSLFTLSFQCSRQEKVFSCFPSLFFVSTPSSSCNRKWRTSSRRRKETYRDTTSVRGIHILKSAGPITPPGSSSETQPGLSIIYTDSQICFH